ncbi:unnamed protein product [Oikopleura dioica]|uniref:Uncharacterized protein n=1 Tax=Oikopleura dioica TaxID=34765 RepID=E4XUC2_OIKDI|nr:unnamed protein product [Oikopleura dioica]
MKEMIYFGLARAIERKTYSLETYLFVLNKYPIAMEMISDLTVFECVLTMMNNPPDLTSDSTADALENLHKFRKVLKRIGRPLDTVSKWINIFRLMASDPLQDLLYMNCSVVEEIFERFQADESVSDLFISQREIFEDQDYWKSVASLLVAIDGDYERSLNVEDQEVLPEVSMSLPKLEMTELENVDEEGWNEEDSDLDLPSDDDDIIAEGEQEIITSNLSDEKTDNSADSVENAALDVEVDQNVDQNEEDNDTAVNNCEENDLDLPADEDEKLDVEEQFASSDQNKIDANEQFKEDSTENQEKNLEEKSLDEEVDANEEHQNFSTECEPSKTVSDDDEEAGWNDGEESDLDLPDENENLPIGEINISEESSKESRDEWSDVNLIPKIVQSDDEEVKSNVFDSHDSKVEVVDNEKSEVSSENTGWDNEESDLEIPSDSVDDSQATIPEISHQSTPDEISKEPHVSSDSIQTELEGLIETRALSEQEPDATIEKDDKPNEPIIDSVPHVECTLSDTSSNDGWDQEESDLELPSDDDQDAEESTTDAKSDESKIQEDKKDEKLSGWNNHYESTFDLASDDAKIEDAGAEDKSGEIVPGKPETTENDAEENEGWQNDDESDLDLPSDLEEDKIDLQSQSPDGWGDESDLDLGSEEPSSPAQVESIVQSPEPEGWNQESDIDLESDKQSDNGGWEDEDLDLVDDYNPLEALLNRYHVALRNPESEKDIKGLISALRNKGEFQKASVLILRLRNTHPAFLNLSALRAADIWEKDMDFS